jgi:hypothetical protein
MKGTFAPNYSKFLPNLITSDEANFDLSGYVDKRHLRHWEENTPRLLHQSITFAQPQGHSVVWTQFIWHFRTTLF